MEKEKITKFQWITIILTIASLSASLFKNEMKTSILNFFSNWQNICFTIGIISLILFLIDFLGSKFLRRLIKTEFADIFKAAKESAEFHSFWKEYYKIDHFFLREQLLQFKADDVNQVTYLYELSQKYKILFTDWEKYGLSKEMIDRLKIIFHDNESKKLKNNEPNQAT